MIPACAKPVNPFGTLGSFNYPRFPLGLTTHDAHDGTGRARFNAIDKN
jgi:hypothetical protein